MYKKNAYLHRGFNFVNNQLRPKHKRLSTLMFYATDLCDSACKHCLIWAKRPVKYLPKEEIIKVMKSKCVMKSTTVGLEGGEFLLHPEALDIMKWFDDHHPNYDLLSNCLKPDSLIEAVRKRNPRRLYISLDGTKETYQHMRGKDGHDNVVRVIETLNKKLPVSVMFTLSPYNDLEDLAYVADVCRKYKIDLRAGVYNNVSFFDTIDGAYKTGIGSLKHDQTQYKIKQLDEIRAAKKTQEGPNREVKIDEAELVKMMQGFDENTDYLMSYDKWLQRKLDFKCFSIYDSLVILPNGDVPVCQNLDVKIGNIYEESLDQIFNKEESIEKQDYHCNNCNGCWLSFHRKYDVVLYRTFEKYFGKSLTGKVLGYHNWLSSQQA
jgi:MoaA/NifB/PqqE/SkfB family radical SAM enzyme